MASVAAAFSMKFALAAVTPSFPAPDISSRRLILPALKAAKKSLALSVIRSLRWVSFVCSPGLPPGLPSEQRLRRSLVRDEPVDEPARQNAANRLNFAAAAGDS